jgi:hypothetical protein
MLKGERCDGSARLWREGVCSFARASRFLRVVGDARMARVLRATLGDGPKEPTMFCLRLLCGLMCLGVISCSESDGSGEGTQENAATADGGVIDLSDEGTDPAVSLIGFGSGDAGTGGQVAGAGGAGGTGGAGGGMPVEPGNPAAPDAGNVATDPDDDDDDESSEEESTMEPEPADAGGSGGAGGTGGGGLVGTVCDLLGGLLCPVGLLCVEGLCQEPTD